MIKGSKATKETKLKMSLARKGIKKSLETRKKMSVWQLGKKHSPERVLKNILGHKKFKGVKLSEEILKKISLSLKGKTSGDKHYNWKGGISKDHTYWGRLRRMRIKNVEGYHTLEEWENLKKKHNYICLSCKNKEPFTNLYYKFLTEDHIIPISKGGSNNIDNIQPLCHSCNSKKRNKYNAK